MHAECEVLTCIEDLRAPFVADNVNSLPVWNHVHVFEGKYLKLVWDHFCSGKKVNLLKGGSLKMPACQGVYASEAPIKLPQKNDPSLDRDIHAIRTASLTTMFYAPGDLSSGKLKD